MTMTEGQMIVISGIIALAIWGLSELFNFITEKIHEKIKKKIAQRKANKFTEEANTHE